MIVHFLPCKSSISYPFIKGQQANALNEENIYIVCGTYNDILKGATKLLAFPSIKMLTVDPVHKNNGILKKELKEYIKNSTNIIWHNLMSIPSEILYICNSFFDIAKKSTVIVYQEDFNTIYRENNRENEQKRHFLNLAVKIICTEFCFRRRLETEYGINTDKHRFTDYIACAPDFNTSMLIDMYADKKNNKTSDCVIQLGHFANGGYTISPILNNISLFKEKNVKLMIPLCYGYYYMENSSQKNLHEIETRLNVLENKIENCVFLKGRDSIDNYFAYLKSLDVAIFNTKSWAAYFSILVLIYFKKTIFIPFQSPIFQFLKANSVFVYPTEFLKKMDINTLKKPFDYSKSSFKWIKQQILFTENSKKWSDYLNALSHEI